MDAPVPVLGAWTLASALEAAARIGATPGGGVSRFAWTPDLAEVTTWVADELAGLGLEPEVDAAGNLVARWPAPAGPAVMTASHLDTVPDGGAFDGALGVLAAVEAVRILRAEGFQPARPIWVGAFMDEEGTRFGTTMFGSRAFCGHDLTAALDAADDEGTTVRAAMAAAGLDPAALGAANRVGEVGAYVELHIEQGPILWRERASLGVVESIAGVLGFGVRIEGEANHAGTTPMEMRRDALAGAARLVLAARGLADELGVRSTVGKLRVHPGAANVIPGAAELTIDVRTPTLAAHATVEPAVRRLVAEIAEDEGLSATVAVAYSLDPAPMDPAVIAAIAAAAREQGVEPRAMVSGAGHDAMVVARTAAAGMVFVPSRDGVSHSPSEWTATADCELGARVLAGTLRRLAS